MALKILCTIGNFTEEAKTELETLGEVTYSVPSQEEMKDAVKDIDVLIVQLERVIDKEIIDAAPNLKVIAIPVTGPDSIDLDYAKEKEIAVLSLKGEIEFLSTVTSTAEHAFALLLALVRKLPAAHKAVTGGSWDRNPFRGHSLTGKTLGIVGYGRLGKIMAQYGEGFGMHVIYTDPFVGGGLPLNAVLEQSDVLSLHVHLSEDTEGMIGQQELESMKDSAVIINTARGKIIDEDALLDALQRDAIGGYATDVLSSEHDFVNEKASCPLIGYAKNNDNVIITPHIGGFTHEARSATDLFIVQKLKDHLR